MARKADLILGAPVSMRKDAETGGYKLRLIASSEALGYIIDGKEWQVSYKTPEGADLADNGNLDFVITLTGTSKDMHLDWRVASGGDAEIYLYEGMTGSAYGTLLDNNNRRRRFDGIYTGSASISVDPTITVTGTLIHHFFNPGTVVDDLDWFLAGGERYLFRVTNRDGETQPASVLFEWHEHE